MKEVYSIFETSHEFKNLQTNFADFFNEELNKKSVNYPQISEYKDTEKDEFKNKYLKDFQSYGFDKNYFEYIILGILDKYKKENYNYYFYNNDTPNSVYKIENFSEREEFKKYKIESANSMFNNAKQRLAPVFKKYIVAGGKYKHSKTAKKRATRKNMKKRTYRSRRSCK
jgi:hypothetical protein